MPTAEIIAIGTELLLGEIQDSNTRHIARLLRDYGIDIFRTMIVGDNADRIAQAIQEGLRRSEIIITTGGLGPTVDDPTRQAVALAMGVELEFRTDLWAQIENRFQRFNRKPTENNKKQAYIPIGALAIENPVGTAPAFIFESDDKSVISLPGVPREMEYLLDIKIIPYLIKRFQLKGTIKACVLHVSGVGESQVDEWIGDLELLSNPTVGLLAHPGIIDIRIAAKAGSIEAAETMINDVEEVIQQRMGIHIYGKDGDSLEQVTIKKLLNNKWSVAIIENGIISEAILRLNQAGASISRVDVQPSHITAGFSLDEAIALRDSLRVDVIVVADFFPGIEKQTLNLIIITPEKKEYVTRFYGGPPQHSTLWTTNSMLDFLYKGL